ncbi:MAG: cation-translocating P-type ATPase, partial [Candidatus Dadabacteria bacterium]|nr:cation-translocating P-type ATPase [Candidatus Dadabacteria bacterium]NIS07343.1 cation-translocating P-type ATPase [Candidatus Dadabacteria bacterium]NIV41287.1 HAD-IC family P-type ATPase [Candidatus Dadabacteria bacterium]NIX14522.1 HAD-IC family P-type ATPase [Candidatus Dadabacteria bacterium]NIY20980.1 HAD-IC family P-type ATPase [Candidatus Dadabacteria bacterium]
MLNSTTGDIEDYKYLDESSFKTIYTSKDSPLKMSFYIEGVHCSGCLGVLEDIPSKSAAIKSVNLNMSTNLAEVQFSDTDSYSEFPELVGRLGYKAYPVRNDQDSQGIKKAEDKKSLYRIGISGVCAGNIMLLSAAIYSGAEGIFRNNFEIINMFLSLPVVTYCAFPFYKSAYSSIKAGKTTVDYPVVFVVIVGFVLSAYNLFRGLEGVYFDSVTIFVFLLLTSRYFIKSIQQKIISDTDLFSTLLKDNKILKLGEITNDFSPYPISELKTGDVIRLSRGQRVPADGTLINQSAVFDLSVLTGESIPKTVLSDSEVYAGSILDSSEADLKVIYTGNNTRLGKILDKVKQNYEQKISFEGFSDKYAAVFTSFVAIVSLMGFFTISNLYGTSEALKRTVSFVLIACPCAFVFILPLTFGMSLKSAVKKGFIIKDSRIFEKIKSIVNIIFDKTGTLTKGKFKILNWDKRNLSEDDISAIMAIESKSHHPVARAIVSNLSLDNLNIPQVINLETIHSRGIKAEVGGHNYEIYSDDDGRNVYDSGSAVSNCVSVFKDGDKISTIYLGDQIREDALNTLKKLSRDKYEIFMLSGDSRDNVELVSDMLSIPADNSFSGLTPEQKIDFVKSKKGSVFVGDGL